MKKISTSNFNQLNKLVSIEKIRKIIETLRDPKNGCPWDIKQNYQSLAPYSIEEAYELVDAIERNNIDDIKNELGDLLLQVILISQVASDKGDFNLDDVANEISKKIIRRHPQIFDHNYNNNDLPQESWDRIKNKETKRNKINSKHILNNIETNIPSTLRSIKIQKKAASLNFDWKDKTQVLKKVDEELGELKDAIKFEKKENIEEELGDLFFTLLNLSRHLKLDPDQTIRKANNKFIHRFNTMENILDETKLKWHSLETIDIEKLWIKAKKIHKEDKNEF
ncbi:nucleoside triphosphate pyrophosphohydrolase [Alphaproteobacteria bacterium]|nr:nucleoside triphosphate pyrophosphohydrolase [Alphaproteobacteria bacterium]MDC1023447.1 nucleoside triphosphate pyrophosphohydrolase [Alphaproteobacteria bacterium]